MADRDHCETFYIIVVGDCRFQVVIEHCHSRIELKSDIISVYQFTLSELQAPCHFRACQQI